jgi:dihydropteroate synthase
VGILNTTPDSFYDGGRYAEIDRAVARADQMVREEVDCIDVGGEKAGPGEAVAVEEELRRVVPVVDALRRHVSVPLSVDTFKPRVAQAAVEAGADIINSIGGFRDPEMRRVAARTRAAVVIMHIKGEPRVANTYPEYANVVAEVVTFLEACAAKCMADGIAADSIVVDPGPDFGKTTAHSIEIVRRLDDVAALGFPVLLAVSRKRFIGDVLGVGAEERLAGSLAVTAWGVMHGVKLVRTHDVRATRRVVAMTEAVLHPELVPTGTA